MEVRRLQKLALPIHFPLSASLGVVKASNATANEIILTAVCSSMTEN
jgi:hypothetical protein